MEAWKSKRDVWKKTRDGAPYKVPKGAVSGVSIGDAISNVYEKSKKGYNPLKLAAAKLKTDLTTYSSKIKPKHAAFCDWIDKNIKKDVADLERAIADDLGALLKIEQQLLGLKKKFGEFNTAPDFGDVAHRFRALMQDEKYKALAEDKLLSAAIKLEEADTHYMSLAQELANYSKALKELAPSFKIALPGMQAHYQTFAWGLDEALTVAQLLVKSLNSKTHDAFVDSAGKAFPQLKALRDSLASSSAVPNAIKTLRG